MSQDLDESPYESTEGRIFIALAVTVALVVSGVVYKKHKNHARGHAKTHAVKRAQPVLAKVPEPKVAAPSELALEVWVKSPDDLALKLLPRLLPPGVPKSAATFTQMMKNGMPPGRQGDVDELDFSKPLGIAVFDAGRFVAAATVKNAVNAKKVIEDYAVAEGAVREHSDALATDMFKGAKTGRYLALVGTQVFLGSDKGAVESAAPRMSAGWPIASTQAHDVVARAPRTWVSGPLAGWAERAWNDWITPQLAGATGGPAKALFDEVTTAAKATWPGAEDVEMVLDVGADTATATATLRATPGSAFANFLTTYPTRTSDALLDVPRDALGGMSLRFPAAWLDTARRFMVTPPPGHENDIPADLRARTEALFGQLSRVLDGDVLFCSVADPPATGGPGANLLRFKVKDDELAKKAARELVQYMVGGPPGTPPPPIQAITMEGGAGESMEIDIPVQPGTPPLPKAGLAWIVRAGHLYVARGTSPRLRVLRFASPKPEDHVGADPDIKARIARLPEQTALTLFMAPFRADTPLPAALKAPPLQQAITVAVSPTPGGVTVHGMFDLDLTAEVVKPMLMQPQQMPPGALPPDAASGMPPPGAAPPGAVPGGPPGVPGVPHPGGMPPGIPGPKGPPATPKSPPVAPPAVPPAPTGYQLPLPKHHSEP